MTPKKKGRKQRRGRGAGSPAESWTSATGHGPGIHFTIGTGPHTDPHTGHLSLEHDARLVKTGLLYADRIKLCSIGSSLTARMLRVVGADLDEQVEFLRRHFTSKAAQNPQAARTALEFLRQYDDLRRTRNSTPEQLKLRGQLLAEIRPIWQEFEQGWKAFAQRAGVEEILAAQGAGLLELHEFSAGGVEEAGALDSSAEEPSLSDSRAEEFFERLTWELFDILSRSVQKGTAMPLLDVGAGELVRLGIEAGEVRPTDSDSYRSRHAGLASDLLRRLPQFDAASVREVLDIRSELDSSLVGFRAAMARLARTVRSEQWSTDFEAAVEEVVVREVEPAVAEIEERLRANRYLRQLSNGYRTALTTGSSMAMAACQVGSLPALASMAVGGVSGAAAAGGEAYEEWAKEHQNIRTKELFFYREAGQRLDRSEQGVSA